jgi:UPF0716 protein FxsA
MRWLTLIFLVVPMLELWLLFQVGSAIGAVPTIGIVVGTALVGGFFAKREGLRVWRTWQVAVTQMRVPEEGLTSGLLVLVGATLLISPGVLTDLVGMLLLVPFTRQYVASVVRRHLTQRLGSGMPSVMTSVQAASAEHFSGTRRDRRVIDVDGKLVDEG